MEITREDRRSVIDHCYLAYFISGMVILIFGVILPNLIEERNLSFTAAGGLLSFLAIGNLCSSLVYPVFCGMMSQKTAVVVLAIPYPVCLFLFTMGLPVPVLYVMIFLIGITKGMITIINNHAIRQVTGSSNQYLNLLHMWYAVGAFLSPFVTMLLMGAGMNWKTILRLLAVLTVLIVLSYATMDYRNYDRGYAEPTMSASDYMTRTYRWMAGGLLVTFAMAYITATTPLIYLVDSLYFLLTIGELALVFMLSARVQKMSIDGARAAFFGYAILNGMVLSYYFLMFSVGTLVMAFLATAVYFGLMAVYGTTTHKDLTGWGPRLMMALVAMIVTSLVGALFGFGFGTSVLYCGIGLVVFMLLTAYDTQKLRQIYAYYAGDAELAEKASIYGALTLYLDFINIFLYVVRLLGMNSRSRNN